MQTAHSVADFAAEHPNTFKQWKSDTNSIICLSVKNEDSLLKFYEKLKKQTDCSLFYEPDVDAYTSLCIYGTPRIRKKLSYLPLSLSPRADDLANDYVNDQAQVKSKESYHKLLTDFQSKMEENAGEYKYLIPNNDFIKEFLNNNNK